MDSTIAVPLMTAYAVNKHPPRTLKRLYDTRERALEHIAGEIREKFGNVPLAQR